jgi:hypothetical protein
MPFWNMDEPLRPGMSGNPVIYVTDVDLDALGVPTPTDTELDAIFDTPGASLKTWNREKDDAGKVKKINDPHWLCVKKGIKMHIDTGFPRYSHQLKVRVDPATYVRGVDGTETMLRRGMFYILDTHSPHEVLHKAKDSRWNVTASIDHNIVLNAESTIKRLIEYAKTTSIMDGRP